MEMVVRAAVTMVAVQQSAEREADAVALMEAASLGMVAASKGAHMVVATTGVNMAEIVVLAREADLVAMRAA